MCVSACVQGPQFEGICFTVTISIAGQYYKTLPQVPKIILNPGDGMESSNLIGPIIGGVLGGLFVLLLLLLLLIAMGVVLAVSLAGCRKSDEAMPNSNGTTIVIVLYNVRPLCMSFLEY